MLQGDRMVINRLSLCSLLLCASHSGMCRIIENDLVQPIDEDRDVVSKGGHWVSSDPCYYDALDVLVSITDGDRSDSSIKKEGRYSFKKMLGPFGFATFTGWGSVKKPSMSGNVRVVHASALVGGIDEVSAVRMLVGVKDSLNRIIHHDGFVEKRKREHEIEIVSSGPVMGGWHITLSCVETGEETWQFDLEMDCSRLGVRKETDSVEAYLGI